MEKITLEELVKIRYAKGEITEEEMRKIIKNLGDGKYDKIPKYEKVWANPGGLWYGDDRTTKIRNF